MFTSALILSLLSTAIARPNGSPVCNIFGYSNSSENPHGQFTTVHNPGYVTVEASSTSAAIRINKQFKGLMLFVTDSKGAQVGSFSSPSSDFTFVSGCTNPRGVLTHANSKSKTGSFTWQCPGMGSFILKGLIHTGAMESFSFSITCRSTLPPKTLDSKSTGSGKASNNTVVGGASHSTKSTGSGKASNNTVVGGASHTTKSTGSGKASNSTVVGGASHSTKTTGSGKASKNTGGGQTIVPGQALNNTVPTANRSSLYPPDKNCWSWRFILGL